MSGASARVRELMKYAELCGFTVDGKDGNEHFRLTHPNGSIVRVACTPGDLRGDDNARAEMRRKSGVTPPRANSGKYKKGVRLKRYTPTEVRVESMSARCERLEGEHEEHQARIVYLLSANDDGDDYAEAMTRLEEIEEEFRGLGRRPPLRRFRTI